MDSDLESSQPRFAEFNRRSFFGIIFVGIVSAALTVIIGRLLDTFVLSPLFCGSGGNHIICSNSGVIALHIGAVLSAIGAVVALVRLAVYRPLLIALAVTIGLWKLSLLSLALPWAWALLSLAVANTLSYLAFSWIVRVYNLIVALVLTLIVVAGMLVIAYQ